MSGLIQDRLLAEPLGYEVWQNLVWRRGARESLTRELLPSSPSSRILDIGCGVGAFLRYLKFATYLGIDTNEEYLKRARRNTEPNVKFVSMDVNEIPNEPIGLFDFVMIFGVLHHLSDADVALLLQSTVRLLSPGGRVATFDPVIEPGQGAIARTLALADRGEFVRTKSEYRKLLEVDLKIETESTKTNLLRLPYTIITYRCAAKVPQSDSLNI